MLTKAKKKAALKNLVVESKKEDKGEGKGDKESSAAQKGEASRYAFLSKLKK